MSKLIAIMQPTYMPWLGYFSLIDEVDEFVFLDCVQLVGRSWQVRNKIKLDDKEKILTIPIDKSIHRDDRMIYNTRFSGGDWKNSHLGTIRMAYGKAPYYKQIISDIEKIYDGEFKSIGQFNINAISFLCERMNIDTPLCSALDIAASGNRDELLADICLKLDAKAYLSAQGSAAYIEKNSPGGEFTKRGIELYYQNYEHPVYSQMGEHFISHIGIYDLLFNVGYTDALKIIRSGRRSPYGYKVFRRDALGV